MSLSNDQIGMLEAGDTCAAPDGGLWTVHSPSVGKMDLGTGTIEHEAVLAQYGPNGRPRMVQLLTRKRAADWRIVHRDEP